MGGELRNRERLSITLPSDLARRLREVAGKEGKTITALIERFVGRAIGDAEVRAEAMHDPLMDKLYERLVSPEVVRRAAKILAEEADNVEELREKALGLVSKRKR